MQVTNVNFGYRSAEITLSNGQMTVSKTFGSHPAKVKQDKLSEPIRSIALARNYVDHHYAINEDTMKQSFLSKLTVPEGSKMIGIHGAIGDCFGKQYITKLGLITCKETRCKT